MRGEADVRAADGALGQLRAVVALAVHVAI